MGNDRETQALLREVVGAWTKGLVLDADALRPEVIEAIEDKDSSRLILTPHAGEFSRIADGLEPTDENIRATARELGATLVLKGSATRIAAESGLYVNPTGNPALSRGGSGDLLAGLLGGLLAHSPSSAPQVACTGVYWHGKAADAMAQAKGQTALRTTDLIDFLPAALEYGSLWNPNSPARRPSGP